MYYIELYNNTTIDKCSCMRAAIYYNYICMFFLENTTNWSNSERAMSFDNDFKT